MNKITDYIDIKAFDSNNNIINIDFLFNFNYSDNKIFINNLFILLLII